MTIHQGSKLTDVMQPDAEFAERLTALYNLENSKIVTPDTGLVSDKATEAKAVITKNGWEGFWGVGAKEPKRNLIISKFYGQPSQVRLIEPDPYRKGKWYSLDTHTTAPFSRDGSGDRGHSDKYKYSKNGDKATFVSTNMLGYSRLNLLHTAYVKQAVDEIYALHFPEGQQPAV